MPLLFSLTLLFNSALLFLVQPMVAKMLLPTLGGSPAVWNTCMVFFQSIVLLGYGYAHVGPRLMGLRWHALLHVGLILVGIIFLPPTVRGLQSASTTQGDAHVVLWIITSLTASIGLPLFLLSSGAPLVQAWFGALNHQRSHDPYFLYAASNVGSMAALLAYPLILEAWWPLSLHRQVWTIGYLSLVGLMVVCVWILWRWHRREPAEDRSIVAEHPTLDTMPDRIAPARVVSWIFLGFVPCSLMLSATQYLTSNIAPVPLLWVVPLGLYLLTFVLVFSQRRRVPQRWLEQALPRAMLVLALVMLLHATEPRGLVMSLHLLVFFIVAFTLHGRFAQDRPHASRLTLYYFWLSVGGALGGMFNGILAPLVFNSNVEYPLVLALGLIPILKARNVADPAIPEKASRAWLGGGAIVLFFACAASATRLFDLPTTALTRGLTIGLPIAFCFPLARHPRVLACVIGAMLLIGETIYQGAYGNILYRHRSFFGTHTVADRADGKFRVLYHGGIVHGMQSLDPQEAHEPRTYFHRTGPFGQMVNIVGKQDARLRDVAVIGLGTGSLAAYARPESRYTFFEIDPAVISIAQNPALFTFLKSSVGEMRIVPGDARLTLAAQEGHKYGMIVLDAFSSEAIPVHLLTREAFATAYLPHLRDDGLLVMHVSNRFLDLIPVVAGVAQDQSLVGVYQQHAASPRLGAMSSTWAVLARSEQALGPLWSAVSWEKLPTDRNQPVWTDEFTNVIAQVRLRDVEE